MRLGVIGTGALGRHHVRLLSSMEGVDLVGIFDLDPAIAAVVGEEFGVRAFDSFGALAGEIDAAVVAVPTVSHEDVGCDLLARGIDVMIEKPLASDLEAADRLVQAAEGRVLAVGHVEFFNPAVQALLSVDGSAGFIEIHRLAVFTPRSLDIDVVLDLMIHDLQILHAIDDSPIKEVRATGISVLSDRVDIANARIALESGCVANLTASRVSAERIRKLRVFMPGRGYYSLDYQEQEIKGFRLEQAAGERRIQPDPLPVEKDEPLKRELQAFVARCRGGEATVVAGAQGRRALKTAFRVLRAIEEQD